MAVAVVWSITALRELSAIRQYLSHHEVAHIAHVRRNLQKREFRDLRR